MTAVAAAVVLVSALLVVSLFGKWMGAAAVGEFLLLRRITAWLGSGAQLGIGVALPRYVAGAVDRKESDRLSYFVAALLCVMGVAATIGLLLVCGRSLFGRWLFGSQGMAKLTVALSLMLLGQGAHAVAYGYYRGLLRMRAANSLQLLDFALLPILVFFLFFRTHSVAFIVSATSAATVAVSMAFAVPALRMASFRVDSIRSSLWELLRYGSLRVPGDFAANALLALGPVIASHYLPISEVSYLLLGLGILTVVTIAALPCGTILLSKISMMIARNQWGAVQSHLEQFSVAVIESSVFVTLQSVIFADIMLRVWVGMEYMKGVGVVRLSLLSIPCYLFFVAMRSAIDAGSVTAHNARSVYMALGVFLGLATVAVLLFPRNRLLDGIAAALLAANVVLAWQTERAMRRVFNVRVHWRSCAAPLVLAAVLSMVAYLVHHSQGTRVSLLTLVLIEAVMTVAFLGLSSKLGSTWLGYFWELLRPSALKAAKETS
jgi:O-antigen/teichoic acid export membrane protein